MVINEKDKSATIEWNINGSRPGQTTYNITATGISPAETRTHIVSGFFNRKYEFIDLEEYRNYSVIVQAITSIGNNQSDPVTFRTLAGPAGPVSNFTVDKGFGDDKYVNARVSWILPDELKRNGPINSFYVQQRENFGNGTSFEVNTATINRENEDTHIYYVTFDVHPESNYTFMVRAITGNLTGEVNVKNYSAPAGQVNLGSSCSAVVGEQVCKDPNAACINGKCTCGSNYYDNNGDVLAGACQLKVDLGSSCVVVAGEQVCKDSNAACNGSKCECGSNYYDDNGSTSAGTCQLRKQLSWILMRNP
ncbi:hypothetical protein CHS0354_009805 [Potamilus streckersoni]|uniref:Fibronectin type-III domain-containing protein n=1 Tax=Potamilus streckersoni TaxID=2493646 RepID=A0AAE0SWP7_9BIVA|nr:hypothetical protein CHS0354_009805 [Potamilus streckersoni]